MRPLELLLGKQPRSASAAGSRHRPAGPAATVAGAGGSGHAPSRGPRGPGLQQMTREQQEAWYAAWEMPGHHFQPPAQQGQQEQQEQQGAEQPESSETQGDDAAWLQLAQWDGAEEGEQQVPQQEGEQGRGQRGREYQPADATGERQTDAWA